MGGTGCTISTSGKDCDKQKMACLIKAFIFFFLITRMAKKNTSAIHECTSFVSMNKCAITNFPSLMILERAEREKFKEATEAKERGSI